MCGKSAIGDGVRVKIWEGSLRIDQQAMERILIHLPWMVEMS